MMKVQTNLSCYIGTTQMGYSPYRRLLVVWEISYPIPPAPAILAHSPISAFRKTGGKEIVSSNHNHHHLLLHKWGHKRIHYRNADNPEMGVPILFHRASHQSFHSMLSSNNGL